jgi:hypothetical protein
MPWVSAIGVLVAVVVVAGFSVLYLSAFIDALGVMAGKDGSGDLVRWIGLPLVAVTAALAGFFTGRSVARARRATPTPMRATTTSSRFVDR